MSSSAATRRRANDVTKLRLAGFTVDVAEPSAASIAAGTIDVSICDFVGPCDTPYDGFAWTLRAHLPADYPLRSPSIGFATPIWHPNVCATSGSICLDVLNSAWTPTYTLEVIVTLLLPQLLSHPNPSDPLNSEAAALARTDPAGYASLVRAHCMKHARPVAAVGCGGGGAGGCGDGRAGGVAAVPPPVTATAAGVAAAASPDWVGIECAARGEEAGSPLSSL